MKSNKIIHMSKITPRFPSDRILDALECLKEYDLEIPVEFIDASDEDGTGIGKNQLDVVQRAIEQISESAEFSVNRLDSYRLAIGAPALTESQIGLAYLFFAGEMRIALIEAFLPGFEGDFSQGNRDAASDLKRALFEGLYEVEE